MIQRFSGDKGKIEETFGKEMETIRLRNQQFVDNLVHKHDKEKHDLLEKVHTLTGQLDRASQRMEEMDINYKRELEFHNARKQEELQNLNNQLETAVREGTAKQEKINRLSKGNDARLYWRFNSNPVAA